MRPELLQRIREKHHTLGDNLAITGAFDSKAAVDRDQRLIRATAISSAIDLDDEVIVPEGCRFDYLNRNRKIFADHQYDLQHCVGTLRNLKAVATVSERGLRTTAWQALIYILPLEHNPLGDDILTIAQEAGIGLSIGFIPEDRAKPTEAELEEYGGGKMFRSICRALHVFEISLTCLPCNPEAQTVEEITGKRLALLDELVTKSKIRRETAELFGLPRPARPAGSKANPPAIARKTIIVPTQKRGTIIVPVVRETIVVKRVNG